VDFTALESLRRYLDELGKIHVSSLTKYHDPEGHGFAHKLDEIKTSRASTATCVLSLIACGKWEGSEFAKYSDELATLLLREKWASAGLQENNAFTVAWILDTVSWLESLAPLKLDPVVSARIAEAETILNDSLRKDGEREELGAASIVGYDPSAYVTQLVVRTLKRRGRLDAANVDAARRWASREQLRQLALLASASKLADVYELVYSTLIVAELSSPSDATPESKRLQQTALAQLFERQRQDGSWELSRPLFHYPNVGNAYCFEYEMLVEVLQEHQLWPDLLPHLAKLGKAVDALKTASFPLGDGGLGWASGHHPQLKGPESWSTASVYHFAHVLGRLVAEALRRGIFAYLDQPYPPPKSPSATFAPAMLDSALIDANGATSSLKTAVEARLALPIKIGAPLIEKGQSLPKTTRMSAILFGPPGTSKTTLAKYIAEYLGWPLLIVDPSHLVREGMDRIQAEANRLFSMLAAAEGLVVLLDEFDEMVRDRSSANTEATSRFLTTAMLPKLSLINERRRIVFLLATNYIDQFDFAISRPGRFDVVIQVMPPTAEEKLRNWPKVQAKLTALGVQAATPDVHKQLESLTFDEFERLAPDLDKVTTAQEALGAISAAYDACTLQRDTEPLVSSDSTKVKWETRCQEQRLYIR